MFWLKNKKLIQIWPRRQKTCLPGFANNKGPDQPAHLGSLFSALLLAYLKVSYLDLLGVNFKFLASPSS